MADFGAIGNRSPGKTLTQRDATNDDFRIVPMYWLGYEGNLPLRFGTGGGGGEPVIPAWGQLFPR